MLCPVCKADNANGPGCRRCKADLTLLWALEEQRAAALFSAGHALAEGRFQAASEDAGKANALRSDRDAMQVQAVAALMSGDFSKAWQLYQRQTEPEA